MPLMVESVEGLDAGQRVRCPFGGHSRATRRPERLREIAGFPVLLLLASSNFP
jgi:hypothetical protein